MHDAMNRRFILVFLAILGLAGIPSSGSSDIFVWLWWGHNIDVYGLVSGYAENAHEHPPIFSMLLWVCFKSASLLGVSPFFTLKTSLYIFTIFSTWLIYQISQKNIFVTLIYYLSTIYSSVYLSYIDVYFLLPLIISMHYLRNDNYLAFSVSFMIAVMTKYPVLIIAPLISVYIINKIISKEITIAALLKEMIIPSFSIIALMYGVFGDELIKSIERCFTTHVSLTGQGLNINWIIMRIIQITTGNYDPFDITNIAQNTELVKIWPLLYSRSIFWVFYFTAFLFFFITKRGFKDLLIFCILAHMSYFIFYTCVHENHLIISCVLSILLACYDKSHISMSVCINIISAVNMFSFYSYNGDMPIWEPHYISEVITNNSSFMSTEYAKTILKIFPRDIDFIDFRLLFSILNVSYFLFLFYSTVGLFFFKQRTT